MGMRVCPPIVNAQTAADPGFRGGGGGGGGGHGRWVWLGWVAGGGTPPAPARGVGGVL